MEWILNASHWFGSSVCDQLPTHSYQFAGVVLPVCARCTGLYLGALLTMIFHTWQHPRAVGLPRPGMLIVLVLFFFAWVSDGVNSFLSVIPSVPHLYPPSNLLRLITGTWMGITVGSLVFVMFNSLVWRASIPAAIFATRREFFALLGLGTLLVVVVQSEWAPLLYPLAVASLVAILTLHVSMMTALTVNLTCAVLTWREALPGFAIGLLVALTYLSVIALAHMVIMQSLPV